MGLVITSPAKLIAGEQSLGALKSVIVGKRPEEEEGEARSGADFITLKGRKGEKWKRIKAGRGGEN